MTKGAIHKAHMLRRGGRGSSVRQLTRGGVLQTKQPAFHIQKQVSCFEKIAYSKGKSQNEIKEQNQLMIC